MNLAPAVLLAVALTGVPHVEPGPPLEYSSARWTHTVQIAAVEEVEPAPHVHPPAPQVSLPEIASRIASCESGDGRGSYNIRAENPVSTASGKYQFINSTWESVTGLPAPASQHAESVQDHAFLLLWDNGRGAFHWNASRHCWG